MINIEPEIIVITGSFASYMSARSTNPMFAEYNRPLIFSGKWGVPFFFALTALIFILSLSLLVWSFIEITWYVNICLIIGALSLSTYIYRFIPNFITGSALGPILSVILLDFLNYLAWKR